MTMEIGLEQLKDAEEIKQLKYRYCRACDAFDQEVMIEHFADDIHIDFLPGSDLGKASTREELKGFFDFAQEPVTASSHHISNFDIRFTDKDHAIAHVYLYSWQRFKTYPETPDCHRWARYEEEWVRTDQGWKQTSLIYRVAGELGGDAFGLRIGEVVGLPVWPNA